MASATKRIELLPCGYQARCRVKNGKVRATTIAWAADDIGRPMTQYELCTPHAEHIAERERTKGREIIRHT